MGPTLMYYFFFFNDTATTEIYTLSLHDALPIYPGRRPGGGRLRRRRRPEPLPRAGAVVRSEEHTSELQSHLNLVCRLLLEKKKNNVDQARKVQPSPCRCPHKTTCQLMRDTGRLR